MGFGKAEGVLVIYWKFWIKSLIVCTIMQLCLYYILKLFLNIWHSAAL